MTDTVPPAPPTPVVEPSPVPIVEPAGPPEPAVAPAPVVEPSPVPIVEPAGPPAPAVAPAPVIETEEELTVSEHATLAGCSTGHVRQLCARFSIKPTTKMSVADFKSSLETTLHGRI